MMKLYGGGVHDIIAKIKSIFKIISINENVTKHFRNVNVKFKQLYKK